MKWLLVAFVGYAAYLLLYPSAVVVWHHRRLLARWLWMTTRHPLLMVESAREVRAEDRLAAQGHQRARAASGSEPAPDQSHNRRSEP